MSSPTSHEPQQQVEQRHHWCKQPDEDKSIEQGTRRDGRMPEAESRDGIRKHEDDERAAATVLSHASIQPWPDVR